MKIISVLMLELNGNTGINSRNFVLIAMFAVLKSILINDELIYVYQTSFFAIEGVKIIPLRPRYRRLPESL